MKRIGVISDTHGCFDDKLRLFLKDVDEIWHAGDIGSLELADEIAAFKPLRGVYGNIDGGVIRRVYNDFIVREKTCAYHSHWWLPSPLLTHGHSVDTGIETRHLHCRTFTHIKGDIRPHLLATAHQPWSSR